MIECSFLKNYKKEWAKKEIELAKGFESEEHDEKSEVMKREIDKYYDAAFEAFCKFIDATDDLDVPGIVKTIFNQLLNEEPLTPIEDNEDDWVFAEGFDPVAGNDNPGWSIYHCKRRHTLFKKVTYNPETGGVNDVKFSDIGRYVCININTSQRYTGGIGPMILDEMFPISMPYSPLGKIKIFTEEFGCYEDIDGDFDIIGILYFRMPDGQMKDVKRYFKKDHKTHEVEEISKTEYLTRKRKGENQKGE